MFFNKTQKKVILDCPAGNLVPISWVFLPWISDCCQLHAVGQAFSVLAWGNKAGDQVIRSQSSEEDPWNLPFSFKVKGHSTLACKRRRLDSRAKSPYFGGHSKYPGKEMQSDKGIRKECMCQKIFKGNAISCQQHEHPARCHPGHAKLERRWMYQTLWSCTF